MTSATLATAVPARRGNGWVRSLALLIHWELLSMRIALPMVVAVQSVVGVGSVLAIGLWFDQVPPGAGLYVTTGGATMSLIIVGLVMGPQLIASQRMRGTYDFLWSLPTQRSAAAGAWVVVALVATAPALVATVAVGALVYDLDLSISPMVVPAVVLTAVTATMIGYALAHGVTNPTLVSMATQVLIFVVFGFSPILFPGRNLPGWIDSVHQWLPVASMADIVRASLTTGLVTDVGRAYVVVVTWLGLCAAIAAVVLTRRK